MFQKIIHSLPNHFPIYFVSWIAAKRHETPRLLASPEGDGLEALLGLLCHRHQGVVHVDLVTSKQRFNMYQCVRNIYIYIKYK